MLVLTCIIFVIIMMIVLEFKYDKIEALSILKSNKPQKKHRKKDKK